MDKNTKRYIAQRKNELLNSLTINNVLNFNAIQRYCSALASGVAPKKIELIFDCASKSVYTTGSMIVINPEFSLVNYYENIYGKLMCIIGLLAHELAHIKYLDFDSLNNTANKLKNEWTWEGKQPQNELIANKIRQKCKESKVFHKLIVEMFLNYNNIFNDVHDEACLFEELDGTILTTALSFPRCAMENSFGFLDDDIYKGMHPLSVCSNLLLYYSRYNNLLIHEESKKDEDVKIYLDLLERCKPLISRACITHNPDERYGLVNEIIVAVFDFFENSMDQKQSNSENSSGAGDSTNSGDSANSEDSGNSGNSSTSSTADELGNSTGNENPLGLDSLSDDDIKDILKDLNSLANQIAPQQTEANTKKNTQSGKCPKITEDSIKKTTQNVKSEERQELEDKLKKKIDSLLHDEVQKQIDQEREEERTAELNKELQLIDFGDVHKYIQKDIQRCVGITERMRQEYNQIYKEVQVYSKAMQRQILTVLKDRREGGKLYGQFYGNRFESKSIARLDGCYFSKTKMPTDSPTIAIGILIDESGSMVSWSRTEYAKRTAIMLEDFARGLNIPTMIYGHNATGATVRLRSYSEFNKIDQNDKYRLTDISAHHCNRDGFAIKYMVEALRKRQEDVKMLFVISDGRPSASGYSGEIGIKDIQNVLSEAKKSGILTFAAAIGEDKDIIANIYGDGFLNISDMQKIPKIFTSLIKKQLKI